MATKFAQDYQAAKGHGLSDEEILTGLLDHESYGPLIEQGARMGLKGPAIINGLKSGSLQMPPAPEAPNPWERFGHGSDQTWEGIKQAVNMAADAISPRQKMLGDVLTGRDNSRVAEQRARVANDEAAYRRGAGDSNGWDIAGNIASTAPLLAIPGGQATLGARLLAGAVSGGAAGGLQFAPEGVSKTGQVALGAMIGAVAPEALRAGGKALVSGARKVAQQAGKGRAIASGTAVAGEAGAARTTQAVDDAVSKALDDAGVTGADPALIDSLRKQANEMLKLGKLDADALKNKATILAVDPELAPTVSQVTRNPAQWTQERNLQKVVGAGDEITGRYQNQSKRLVGKLGAMTDETGGNSLSTPYDFGTKVSDAVESKWKEMQSSIGAMYKDATDKFGNEIATDGTGLHSVINGELADMAVADQAADGVVRGTLSRMKRLGLIDDAGELTGNILPIEKAEQLRKFIGGLPGTSPTAKMVRAKLVESLDDDVFSVAGMDAYQAPRAAARARFEEFSAKPLKAMAEGEITPEKVFNNLIIGGKVDDLQSLTKSLKSGTPEQIARGDEVLRDVKAQVMAHLAGAANKGTAEAPLFSHAAYDKALKAIGKDRMKVLFSPDEIAMLDRIGKASELMMKEPAYAAVNHSNTTPAAIGLLNSAATSAMPGWMGGASRVVQEATKQNQQTKLANALLSGAPEQVAEDPAVVQRLIDALLAPKPAGFRLGANWLSAPAAAGATSNY